MKRVIDLESLHTYLYNKSTNGQITIEARSLALEWKVSVGTIYTAIREMVSDGRLTFSYKTPSRHAVYKIVDPCTNTNVPTMGKSKEPGVPRGRKPVWG